MCASGAVAKTHESSLWCCLSPEFDEDAPLTVAEAVAVAGRSGALSRRSRVWRSLAAEAVHMVAPIDLLGMLYRRMVCENLHFGF